MTGYNALMAKFGPIITDLERLKAHIECRYSQITEHCNVLEKNRIQVNEPILIVQKTTREALSAVYKDNRQRLEVIAPVAVHIQAEVLQPLNKLIADIKEELENVVRFYGKYAQKLERTRKAVILATKEVSVKEQQFAEAKAVAKNLNKNQLEGVLKKNGSSQRYVYLERKGFISVRLLVAFSIVLAGRQRKRLFCRH